MTILPNGVATCDGDTHHQKWIRESGRLVHDWHFAEVLREYIQHYKVRTCIDGGANIGTLTVPMLEQGCRVIAFEPNDEARECLVYNTKKWAGPDLEIRPEGLSDRSGILVLKRQINAGASYLIESGDEALVAELLRPQSVPIISIDEYLEPPPGKAHPQKIERIGLIKLDIEGFEVKALEGARRTIERWHPILVIEVNDGTLERCGTTKKSLFDLLKSHGYAHHMVHGGLNYEDPQYDIVAWVPK